MKRAELPLRKSHSLGILPIRLDTANLQWTCIRFEY